MVSLYFPSSSRSKGMPTDCPWQPRLPVTLSPPWASGSLIANTVAAFACLTVGVPFEACLYRSLIVVVSVVITKAADEQFNEKEYSREQENNEFQQEWHLFSTHQYNLSVNQFCRFLFHWQNNWKFIHPEWRENLYTHSEEKLSVSLMLLMCLNGSLRHWTLAECVSTTSPPHFRPGDANATSLLVFEFESMTQPFYWTILVL